MDGTNGNSAIDTAKALRDDAKKTMGEIKGGGLAGFFSFERLYFPLAARFFLMAVCVVIALAALFGVVGGLVAMVSGSMMAGLGAIAGALIFGVISLLAARIWFEMLVVAFRINENLEALKNK